MVDAKGRPVLDLSRDEFAVEEDGAAQEIVSFERVASDDEMIAGDTPSPRTIVSSVARPPRSGATFALIVDDQGLGEREARNTRDALSRFLTSATRDGDGITLATTSGEVSRAFDSMYDYEAFAIRDREDRTMVTRIMERWTATGACMVGQGRQDPSCPARVRATAASVDGIRRKRTQLILATLRRTLEALARGRGRKSILIYSRGFLQDSDPAAREVAAAAREANAAVYFIDARGLQVQPGLLSAADAGVVLRDPRAGAMGAVSHRFEVPGTSALRVTTPILTDRVEPAKVGDERPRVAVAVGRAFHPHGPLYCEFEVLGAKADPVLRAPRVSAGVEVRTAGGETVRKGEPTPIASDARGRVVRLVGIGMDGLSEGDYQLVLDVRDEVSGARIQRQEPFTLRNLPD